jgi:8-amino-7-oxononanoate synthase
VTILTWPTLRREHQLISRAERSAIVEAAAEARAAGPFPFFTVASSPSAPRTVFAGTEVINLGSNNYLGLAADERVIEAAVDAVRTDGTGLTGSRLMNGNSQRHDELEELLCRFTGKEACLVFSTGYGANLGALTGLLEDGDTAFVDAEAHASLIDGVKMSGATMKRVRHAHLGHFSRLAAELPTDTESLYAVDGVYSMRGDAPNMAEIVDAADEFGVTVYDDEAHGLGVLGATGIGAAERDGVVDRVPLIFYTFSKSLASCGGAVLGPSRVIEHLRLTTRPFLFTASNTPASIAAATEALRLLIAHPHWPSDVRDRARHLAAELDRLGVPTLPSDSAIVSVPTGDVVTTFDVWARCFEAGVFVNPVLPPAVREGQCLLRLSVMRTHSHDDLSAAAEMIAAALP